MGTWGHGNTSLTPTVSSNNTSSPLSSTTLLPSLVPLQHSTFAITVFLAVVEVGKGVGGVVVVGTPHEQASRTDRQTRGLLPPPIPRSLRAPLLAE